MPDREALLGKLHQEFFGHHVSVIVLLSGLFLVEKANVYRHGGDVGPGGMGLVDFDTQLLPNVTADPFPLGQRQSQLEEKNSLDEIVFNSLIAK